MFCNVPGICSVSAGDVMEINGEYHLILGLGFLVISEFKFGIYKAMPQSDRNRLQWLQPNEISEKLTAVK